MRPPEKEAAKKGIYWPVQRKDFGDPRKPWDTKWRASGEGGLSFKEIWWKIAEERGTPHDQIVAKWKEYLKLNKGADKH